MAQEERTNCTAQPRLHYSQLQTQQPELLRKYAKKTDSWFETECQLTFDSFAFDQRGSRRQSSSASGTTLLESPSLQYQTSEGGTEVTKLSSLKVRARRLGLSGKRKVPLLSIKHVEFDTQQGEALSHQGFTIRFHEKRAALRFKCPSPASVLKWVQRFQRLRIPTFDGEGKKSKTLFDMPAVPLLHPKQRREYIVKEIVDKELTYYKTLDRIDRLLVDYRKAMHDGSSNVRLAKGMCPDVIEKLLVANEALLDLSKMLLDRFQAVGPTRLPLEIGAIFKKISNYFLVFIPYTNESSKNQSLFMTQEKIDIDGAKKRAKAWFGTTAPPTLWSIMQKIAPGISCNSLFMQPVQKVMRYVLLLKDLVKRTPLDVADRTDIVSALEVVKDVAKKIDFSKGEMEMKHAYFFKFYQRFAASGHSYHPKLFLPQADMSEHLRFSGTLRKFKAGVLDERECFVLDTYFVYSKKDYNYIAKKVLLSDLTVDKIPAAELHIKYPELRAHKHALRISKRDPFRSTQFVFQWIFLSTSDANLSAKSDVDEWMAKIKACQVTSKKKQEQRMQVEQRRSSIRMSMSTKQMVARQGASLFNKAVS